MNWSSKSLPIIICLTVPVFLLSLYLCAGVQAREHVIDPVLNVYEADEWHVLTQ